jgi:hypothetical protein
MAEEHTKSSGSPKGGVKIDKIDAPTPVTTEKGWVTVIKSFNPFGAAAEAYARTLAYRIEMKRLDSEMERVRIQAGVITDALDKSFKLKMEELNQRRLELDRFYDTVQGQLKLLHIERMQVLKMAEKASDMALSSGVSIEERRLFKEMAVECTNQLADFGGKANESLDVLVKSLPQLNMPDRLIAGGD